MKKWPVFFILIIVSMTLCQGRPADSTHKSARFKGIFIENKGQWDPAVLFKADLPYGALFLENNILTFNFLDQNDVKERLSYKYLEDKDPALKPPPGPYVNAHAYKVEFEGANEKPGISTPGPFPEYDNYFLGNDASRWASGVRHYPGVTYQDIYKGIDLEINGYEGKLKYTFSVAAGSDASLIRMNYVGVDKIKIRDGKLVVKTSVSTVEELSPLAWQLDAKGDKMPVKCRFHSENTTVSFIFPDGYDKQSPLVIDPVLVFSTYSGSPVDNWGYTATYDNYGFLYSGGNAFIIGYPTVTGSYQMNYGGGSSDIVISKYDTTGSFMVYSTYLGGSGSEVPTSLIVNNNNELIILGTSGSADFPVTGQSNDPVFSGGTPYVLTTVIDYTYGSDLVISKLSSDGSNMLASTYFGGSGNDGLNTSAILKHNYADDARGEVKLDDEQNIYICSSTQSPDLPVSAGALQTQYGGQQDACIVKFDPTLTYVLWSTYLGGSTADAGYSIIMDDTGNVYVAGGTTSDDFPVTAGSLQQNFNGGSCDGYISCFNQDATAILHSTFFGSTVYDQIYFIDKDKLGNIYVLGQTTDSGSTFIHNAAWSLPGGGQFISKLNTSLSGILFSTTFGSGNGGPDISPTAFMVDNCNNIYLSGWGGIYPNGFGGTSGLPVTPDAFQTTTDGKDYYFLVMKGDASGLVYATFFGGSSPEHVDGGTSRFDKKGRIYQSVCAGCGGIDDFPTTPGAWSNINGSSNCNNAVIKFDFKIPLVIADFMQPPAGCAPDTVNFQNTSYYSGNGTVYYHWDFGDGDTSTDKNPVHIYTTPGVYSIMLIVNDTGSCNVADTLIQSLYILGKPTVRLPEQRICKYQSVKIGVDPIPDPSLTYTWFPSNNLNNPVISNPIATPLQSMDYYLLISNGICADTVVQFIRVYDLQVEAGNDTILCTNTIQLTATANEDSVYYQWSTNPQFSDTLNNTSLDQSVTVNLLNQVTWFYVMIYNDLCSARDSIRVSFSILISPGGGQDPSCPDSCDGSAVVTLTGGIPPFTYLWSNGQQTPVITGLCQGNYYVTVTDSANCISVATIHLIDPPDLLIDLETVDIPCSQVCTGEIHSLVSGGTSPYHYLWSNGETTLDLTSLCEGAYTLSVTDDHGCPAQEQAIIEVYSIFQNIEVNASPDSIYQGLSTQLHSSLLAGCTYQWSPLTGLSDPLVNDPVANPWVSTTYYLTITDPFGCQYIDSVSVIVKEVNCREPYIFIPSAFTPNGDNKNDVMTVQGNFIEKLQLSIYDRWGNRVFETTDPSSPWDGRYNGQECEPGVYVYYLEVGCYNKETFSKKGNITLIR